MIGSWVTRTPVAAVTALAMVAAGLPMVGSPIPLAPNGPLPSPLSTMIARTSGRSAELGMR